MPLEQELAANTAAMKELTAAILAASAEPNVKVVHTITPAATPASEDIELPAAVGKAAPGKKTPKAAPAAADDTPSVQPKVAEPGAPAAGEHVDVDEVIAEIGEIVKQKIVAAAATGEDDAVKEAWGKVREGFKVARIGELKGRPADLLKALAAAKAL
jgi:hypothetical protein